MKKQDPALSISNPRLLAAVYFGLLSVVGTILTNALLTSIGFVEVIPVFKAIILGMVVASCTGAIFGERIVHCPKPYMAKTFWLGFLMVIASLPIFVLGITAMMEQSNNSLFSIAKFHNMVYVYLITLAYSYVLFGIVLAIGSGLVAMYLRGHLVYDILSADSSGKRKRNSVIVEHKERVPHKIRSSHH